MHHPTSVVNYGGTMEELAKDVANLRYDALYDFLQQLSSKIAKDSYADRERGRLKLSEELRNAAYSIRNAWIICKPHMSDGSN